jgi:hypothetical protein
MEMADIRRERLREWFEKRAIPKEEKSYISQLINGKAPFGERSARRLEKTYEMGDKYLDQLPLLENTPDDRVFSEFADVYSSADSKGRALLREFIELTRKNHTIVVVNKKAQK